MANVYWHADGGNWSDHATHWFNATDGGGGGHGAAPGVDDNAIFDANSFDNPGQTVTVDATANCLDMTWTGATNTPTLTTSNTLNIYGDITFIAAMVLDGALPIICAKTGTQTITTNTLSIGNVYLQTGIGTTVSFQDAFVGNGIRHTYGTLLTNNNDITLSGDFRVTEANATVLTMGSSAITCARWRYTGSNFTLTANTGTIKVTGTGAFEGGGITTYNNVELNGSAHTVSGSNTFASLTLKADTTQTITFTDGTTQTITTPTVTGSVGKVKTLVGSSTAGWIITKVGGGTVTADYLALSYSEGRPQRTWIAGIHSTDTILNTGWLFGRDWAERSGAGWWIIGRGRYQ